MVCTLIRKRVASGVVFSMLAALASFAGAMNAEGLRFSCTPGQLTKLESGMAAYLSELNIAPAYVAVQVERAIGTATYTLTTPTDDVTTLDFFDRPEFHLQDAVIEIPLKNGKKRKVKTASHKEILLALLQHGRLTEFKGAACDINALKDHIGIRQNIAAWAEELNFVWPDGGPAKWNEKYWKRGTPRPGFPLHVAMNDMFLNQKKYKIGCYTATKMVVIQAMLDYYRRVRKDPAKLKLLEQRLSADGQPLLDVEPGRVWDFEAGFDQKEFDRPGKVLSVQYGIAPKNFIPGDWAYLLNTDPQTYQKTGYEGSNAIYLGRGKFDDYYNDHNHAYSYRQKLHEVYQWRNHVFSRSRDADKVKPLTARDIERLGRTPAEGGIVLSLRISPHLFGYQALPAGAPAKPISSR